MKVYNTPNTPDKTKMFDPWAKVKHAWDDKTKGIDQIEQYNSEALPDVEDFLAVLADFEENDPEMIDVILTFQDPKTLLNDE